MKIKVRQTEHCVVLGPVGNAFAPNFFLLKSELEILSEGQEHCFMDCGNVLQVISSAIVFFDAATVRSAECGTVGYLKIEVDSFKLFATIKKLLDKGIITEQWTELRSERFEFKRERVPGLSFSQIINTDAFQARKKLCEAVRVATKTQLINLREHLSRLLMQGKTIVDDGNSLAFYFYPTDGKGYNGGIIYSGKHGFSVHT